MHELYLEDFEKHNKMLWPEFNDDQERFMRSKAHFLLGHGGYGSGKTHVLAKKTVALLTVSEYFGDCSGNKGLMGRCKEKDFYRTTLPEFMKSIPKSWIQRQNKEEGWIELINESLLYLTHLESKDHLQSLNISFAAVDQIEEIPEDVFDCLALERVRNMIMARYKYDEKNNLIPILPKFVFNEKTNLPECVSTDPDELDAVVKFHTVFGVANPKPGWLKRRFILNEKYRTSLSPALKKLYNSEYESIELPVVKNQANLPPGYIARQKENKTAREYARDVGGSWNSFEGQVHDNFTSDLINPKNITPNPAWKIYVGIDHGGSSIADKDNIYNTKAIVFKALEQNHGQFMIHTFDELYLGGNTIEEAVQKIDTKLQHWAVMQKHYYPTYIYSKHYNRLPVHCWRCDPNMRKKAADSSDETIMEVYMRFAAMCGFNMSLEIGNNEVATGIEKINWIHKTKHERINPCCKNYINEHINYMYDKGEKPADKQPDHLVTANRYICSAMNFWWDSMPQIHNIETRESKQMKLYRSMNNLGIDNIYGSRYIYA